MPDVTVLGPVAYREFQLEQVCNENQGHQHNYDHITVVRRGSLKVFWGEPEKESRVFRAGDFFLVRANIAHRIKAMEPDTKYACVFTHRDHEGQVVQEYEGHLEAYDVAQEPAHV